MNPLVNEQIQATPLTRRGFLGAAMAAVVAACSDDDGAARSTSTTATTATTSSSTTTLAPVRLASDPFTLGVASGDPLEDGVVLWTRLAPDPLGDGGMPSVDVPVVWEVANDERFGDVVREGVETATPGFAHALHVDVRGLDPDRWYFYRFRVGEFESAVGRTRTLPASSARPDRLRFAFASCQHFQAGFYAAHRELADEDLDIVLFLGDYMYEGGIDGDGVRQHDGPAVTTLDAYRARYGLYKGDADLQASHAAFPWVVVWDDHEVVNNYAGAEVRTGESPDEVLARRAAAYQAWYEHQPVRLAPPTGPDLEIHRSLAFGDLAELFALDTRQYRSVQACGQPSDVGTGCLEVDDEARTLLGAEQEQWVLDGVGGSDARWRVLAQQVVMAATPVPVGNQTFLNLDQWDGYPAQRRRLLAGMADRGVANAVVLTGDIHASGVADLRVDFEDTQSPIVASELVGTSISSDFPATFIDLVESAASAAPHVHWYDARHRGYVRCEVTPDAFRAEYRLLDDARRADAMISTARAWVIEDGRAGITEA